MIITTDLKWISSAEAVYKLQQKRKKIEEMERAAIEELKILSQDKTTVGGKFLFAKEERKGSIDYKAVPVLRGLDLEPYRKENVIYFKLSII